LSTHAAELALVAFDGIGGDMFEDGGTAQLATNVRLDHE
jgi:hypothetical protein